MEQDGTHEEKIELYVLVCQDDLSEDEFMNTGYDIEDLHFAIKQIPEAIQYKLIESN